MDVAKDNLRQFVERWNEHPNSPYVFEITNGVEINRRRGSLLSDSSSQSLVGDSPSPCASLASSPEDDSIFLNNNVDTTNNDLFMSPKTLTVASDHLRRASDSSCFMKNQDITERINLAQEIRQLSDKLFRLSNIETGFTNGKDYIDGEEDKAEEPKEKSTVLPKDHPQNPSCSIPWRRTKYKVNANSSRDVPLSCRSIYKRSEEDVQYTAYQRKPSDANGTKDLLLQLLQNWDGPKTKNYSGSNTRHGSVSEWTDDDTLGQRTISSLNNFFQSRAANKKITPFHFNKS